MKKLQNNFTTIEQSKRLLELGVPAWTADFFYPTKKSDMPIIIVDIKVGWNLKYAIPCWSVGRLMEIYGICSGQYTHNMWLQDALTCILADIEFAVDYGNIDFSKLEEV